MTPLRSDAYGARRVAHRPVEVMAQALVDIHALIDGWEDADTRLQRAAYR